ncbi:hypothetical protein D1224_10005 [Henriciella barbarensis]|uniref:Uncharacterized protein n=1 Tax=Henriciella barbarensis TaxID=86342 RepID=A0A399R055_9PROT|nr:hypothetical protein D1224_10005 [Henriciella barbarensis]
MGVHEAYLLAADHGASLMVDKKGVDEIVSFTISIDRAPQPALTARIFSRSDVGAANIVF